MMQLPTMSLAQTLRAILAEYWRIIRREPPELLEIAMGLHAFAWGAWLMLPFPSVSPLSDAAGNPLNSSTEVYFGAWFVLISLFKFAALTAGMGYATDRACLVRQASAALLLMSWAFVAFEFHLANPLGTGTSNYGYLMLVQGFLFARQVRCRAVQ